MESRFSRFLPHGRSVPRWLVGLACFTVLFTFWGYKTTPWRRGENLPEVIEYTPPPPELLPTPGPSIDIGEPPTWERLKKWQADLPQHNLDLPFPEGRNGRFVIFRNQLVGTGWNNQFSEM